MQVKLLLFTFYLNDRLHVAQERPDSIFRLWRSIKHLLTYLLTYLHL